MNQVLRSLSLCALLALGGGASAQGLAPRSPGEDLSREERQERREERRERRGERDGGARADRGGRGDEGRRDRADRQEGRDRADRGGDNDRRDRADRFDDRRDRRDGPDTRIVVRPAPDVRSRTVIRREPDVRPGFVITQPSRPTRLVCTVVRERRFNPNTGVVRIRPVRECARFVGRRRVIVNRQILG